MTFHILPTLSKLRGLHRQNSRRVVCNRLPQSKQKFYLDMLNLNSVAFKTSLSDNLVKKLIQKTRKTQNARIVQSNSIAFKTSHSNN